MKNDQRILLPLLPNGGEGRGEEDNWGGFSPLTPPLSPLGRGEGVVSTSS